MKYRINGQRRWTVSAVECFKRGCVCSGCFYENFFTNNSQKCQMKGAVMELVRVFGKPEQVRGKTIIEE